MILKKEKGIVQDQPLSWQVAPWVGSRAGGRQAGSRRVTRNVCVVWHRRRRPHHRGETRLADAAIMTALSPFSRPVALLCIHLPPTNPPSHPLTHITSIINPVGHQGTTLPSREDHQTPISIPLVLDLHFNQKAGGGTDGGGRLEW